MRFASLLAALFLFTACPGDDDAPPVDDVDAGDVDAARPDAEQPDAGPSCSDGVQNGEEGGVDCGGACDARCAVWTACSQDSDCEANHHCASGDAGDDHTRTCRPRVESCIGDPCGAEAYCRQYISGGTSDEEIFFCEQRKPLGAVCFAGDDKDVNVCAAGLRCQNDQCASAPQLFQSCERNLGFTACAEGLACVSGAFGVVCQTAPGENAACTENSLCGPGLHCDEFARTCQPRAGKDGSCYASEAGCGVGLECQFEAGLACEIWFDCGSQMECCATADGKAECRVDDSSAPQCQPPAGRCDTHTYLDNDL